MHNTTVSGTRTNDLCYFIVNGKCVQISRNILIRIVVTWKVTLLYPAYVSLIRKIMTRIASKTLIKMDAMSKWTNFENVKGFSGQNIYDRV